MGVYGGDRFLARETSAPNLQLSYSLARYLEDTLQGKERAIILVKPIPSRMLQYHLDKVYAQSGGAGLASARRVLLSMDTAPPEYQRTLVHSRLGKQRLLSFGGVAASEWKPSEWPDTHAAWIAVWSDFEPQIVK